MFDANERDRYSRHFLLHEIGLSGQERLKNSVVTVIGAGGLGSPSLLYLAAAGIGRLRVVEFDRIERSNLQRQILYSEADLSRPKLDTAVERLRALNPAIHVDPVAIELRAENAIESLQGSQVVVDGSDNFSTRYLVNDASLKLGIPLVSASVLRFEGQLGVFGYKGGGCYRCLFPEPPTGDAAPSCAEAGVLGAVPGVLGSLQAIEVIKILAGDVGQVLSGSLLVMDFLEMEFRTLKFKKRMDCAACSLPPSQIVLKDLADACVTPILKILSADELKLRLKTNPSLFLLDVREESERAINGIEGSTLIPLRALPSRLSEIPRDREIVVYCKSGARSARACAVLAGNGIQAANLAGGMDAWESSLI
ncbi:MAG: molybdopterin-synthase adenylyltransferase MoeB [Bdellovibrionota bacterium]